MTLTAVIPAMIIPRRIVGAVTSVDSTAIVPCRIVRSLPSGESSTIITRRVIDALPSGEAAIVVPGRSAEANTILLGDRRTDGLQHGAASAGAQHEAGYERENESAMSHDAAPRD
ncbi:MAG TPA: hypothetical protein VFZ90_15780 [Gemmatimonadales bacterium]